MYKSGILPFAEVIVVRFEDRGESYRRNIYFLSKGKANIPFFVRECIYLLPFKWNDFVTIKFWAEAS